MRIAVLSDLHSNAFALREVLKEVESRCLDEIWLLGDIFGYYPWAADTFELLQPFQNNTRTILGNHDLLLLRDTPPSPKPSYWNAAVQNRMELEARCSEAMSWLASLELEINFICDGLNIRFCHGTPDNPRDGRYYPDNTSTYSWFPSENEILFLGQTHYPLIRTLETGGIIINPGSVGQPRDFDSRPAWGVFDTNTHLFELCRTRYDQFHCIQILEEMNWDKGATKSLNKVRKA